MTTAIAIIALILSLLPIAWAVRRYFKVPEFRVRAKAILEPRSGRRKSGALTTLTLSELTVTAIGGGQNYVIIDAHISRFTLKVAAATETTGTNVIEIPADLPTKFLLTFDSANPPSFGIDATQDTVTFELVLDLGGVQRFIDVTLNKFPGRYESDPLSWLDPLRVPLYLKPVDYIRQRLSQRRSLLDE